MTDDFLSPAKMRAFQRDLDRLRDAVYASDDADVYEAWHEFEAWIDCININPTEGEEK